MGRTVISARQGAKGTAIGELVEIANQDFFKTNAKYGYYPPNVEVDDSILTDESLEVLISPEQSRGREWGSCIPTGISESLNSTAYYGDTAIAVGSSGSVLISRDRGDSWGERKTPFGAANLTSVAMTADVCVIGSNQGTVVTSTNAGESFGAPVDVGFSGASISGVAVGEGYLIAVGPKDIIARSTDLGAAWTVIDVPSLTAIHCVGIYENTVVVGTSDGYVIKSLDAGMTWGTRKEVSGKSIFGIWLDSSTIVTVGRDSTIYRSVNGGLTWLSVDNPLPGVDEDIKTISMFADGIGLAGSDGGNLIRTTNFGVSWSYVGALIDVAIYGSVIAENFALISGSSGCIKKSYASINHTTPSFASDKAMKLELK